ncbi:NADP-dependent alcohol dehydrogenase [Marasmius fiardii PR-910]|nr:NADP-dependent alcohol dehydrogenase [Marasmius fiardii PR-910]
MGYEGTTFRGSQSGQVVKSSFSRDKIYPDEVVIKVTHSGICGTDLHFLKKDMVLGHEGVGVAIEVGSACTRVKVGDRVGWGYPHSTCMSCDHCIRGDEQWCPKAQLFGEADLDQGSFSNLAIRKEHWLFVVPDGLKSEQAAPLMCGGATVFEPLIEHVKPIDRVGIVGVGGLGHLAIAFAAKMGCDVVVFSGTEAKREEAMKLGASEFYATQGVSDYSTLGLRKPLNHLLITTSVAPEHLDIYYPLLDEKAKVFPLTVDFGNINAPYGPTIFRGIQIIGSKIANRYNHTKMLDFAARNKVFPIIEVFPMSQSGANEAIRKLQEGNVRYRAVLAW